MGSPGKPDLYIQVAGASYDPIAHRVELARVVPFSRDASPILEWSIRGGAIPTTMADDFRGKIVQLLADEGSGSYLVFQGRCESGPTIGFDHALGWLRSYAAEGMISEGNRVPVTNPTDGTDAIEFNVPSVTSPDYRGALAGRSIGQIVRYVLEGSGNATALKALGVGSYATIPTVPATAHATVAGGAVTIVIDSGGSGYSNVNPPALHIVGGGGTYTSSSVTVSGGAITAASVSGSSGYTTAPEVWISPLPIATLRDLGALTIITPYQVTIHGERILQALADQIRSSQPNHFLHVLPDGTIRVYDQRTFTPVSLTMNSTNPSDPKVDVTNITFSASTRDCYSRVIVRGGPDTVAVTLSTLTPPSGPGGLTESFAHDGLTNTDAKNYWTIRDWIQPGDPNGRATGNAAINGSGVVTSIAVGVGGYNYPASSSSITVTLDPPTSGTTATAHATTDSSGHVNGFVVDSGGSGYTVAPLVTVAAPPGVNRDSGTCTCPSTTTVRVTSADSTKTWAANFWDQSTTGRKGTIWLTWTAGTGIDIRFSAPIVSHGSLSAGGTCDITVAIPLPVTSYNQYEIFGTAGGATDVWRKYAVDSTYAGKLQLKFPRPVAYRFADGTAVTLTSTPMGIVRVSSGGGTSEGYSAIDIDPDANVIRFQRPVVLYSEGNYGNLVKGGSAITTPTEIKAFLAISRGNLSVVSPANVGGLPQYTGTSNTIDGLQRTLTVTVPSWIDTSNTANMQAMSDDLLDSVKDTTIETTVPIHGWQSSWFTPGNAISLGASGWTSPWSTMAVPVLECAVHIRADSGSKYLTTLRASNRRQHFTSSQFARPQIRGVSWGAFEEFDQWSRLTPLERLGRQLYQSLENVETINDVANQWARQIQGS